jgi:hypothetical protein
MKFWKIAAFAMLPLSLACGSSNDSTAPDASAYVGSYTLTKIDGQSLPTTISEGGTDVNVTAGSAQILANGTWSAALTATPVALNLTGTYTVSGNSLILRDSNDGTSTATLSGDQLTVTTGDETQMQLLFTKGAQD